MKNTTTATTIPEILKNAKMSVTTESNGEVKVRETQRTLKNADFPDRKTFAKYVYHCNRFTEDLEKILQTAANEEKTVSKKQLLDKLQIISKYLSYEGVKIDDKEIQFKNYHVNFIIRHCTNLKLQPGTEVKDVIKSESYIRRLIELGFYFELNGLPVPSPTISEKSLERIEKNRQKVTEYEETAIKDSTANASAENGKNTGNGGKPSNGSKNAGTKTETKQIKSGKPNEKTGA